MASEDSQSQTGPFLLIVRTGRIVTIPFSCTLERECDIWISTAGCSGFPAYSRVCSRWLPSWSRNLSLRPPFTGA
jgi:hypothetical protein